MRREAADAASGRANVRSCRPNDGGVSSDVTRTKARGRAPSRVFAFSPESPLLVAVAGRRMFRACGNLRLDAGCVSAWAAVEISVGRVFVLFLSFAKREKYLIFPVAFLNFP